MNIKLDGVKSLMSALNRVDKKFTKKADNLIAGAAVRTVGIAKMRLQPHPEDDAKLSADIGAVRQSINFDFDPATHSASVFAGNVTGDHMAAYLEFGTGKYAAKYVNSLPEPYQKLAMRFYVNGKGRMREHPYLIPAYMQEGQRLKDKLKNLKVGW